VEVREVAWSKAGGGWRLALEHWGARASGPGAENVKRAIGGEAGTGGQEQAAACRTKEKLQKDAGDMVLS
jgi:hypothetical protein